MQMLMWKTIRTLPMHTQYAVYVTFNYLFYYINAAVKLNNSFSQ